MRQLQSAQYPDICCDPGTAAFVENRVKNSLSELSAKTPEAASDLWDTLWSSDIKDLKVKKGKECPSALQRAGGSH